MRRQFDLSETLRTVLSEPRFDAPSETAFDRLLQRILNEAIRLLAALVDAVGGPLIAALIALGIVVLVTIVIASRLAGRRAAVIEERLEIARLLGFGADPATYLDAAREASERGEHAAAIRFRFVGGVLTLGRAGRIRYEPGLTTGGIADQVDDPLFSDLAEQFDRIAYGRASAGPEDDRRSAEAWAALGSTV